MMPGAIDSRKQYASLGKFARDERKMLRAGWTIADISLQERPLTRAQRVFSRPPGVTVDAHYVRSSWPVE